MSEKLTTEAPPPYPAGGDHQVYPPQQGYPDTYPPQQGYPDQGGYPPQQGYPDQGGYPPQQGYPDQGGYPPQQGYPVQGGYPQQPQQPPSYPQQPGYPQQQKYPAQGGQGHAYPQSPLVQQQTTSNVTVVTAQPAVQTVTVGRVKPDNQLFLSLFSMLFCCFFFGLVALMYSIRVDSAYNAGDYTGSVHSAIMARRWSIISIVSGVILIFVIGGLGGASRVFY